jgi:transcriptional regulator with XRE-family HTH domain
MDGVEESMEGGRLTVASALRAGRRGLGLTQKELAEKAHIGYSTVRGIEENEEGKQQHRPLTLKALSVAIKQQEDYLSDIQEGRLGRKVGVAPEGQPEEIPEAQPEGTGDEPERTDNVTLQHFIDAVTPCLDKIVVTRLNEIVVPSLNKIDELEKQIHALADIFHNPKSEIETHSKHPGGGQGA